MSDSGNENEERTSAEKITLVISVAVLVAILCVAIWASARTGTDPASITVVPHPEQVRESDGHYYLPITITNTGGLTAQDVTVTGELNTGEPQPETAEVTINFLAGDESERAELVFTTPPDEGELTVGVTSYLEP